MSSDFFRNALTLISGTTLAQAIGIGSTPILSRIFSPEDFGIFGIFTAAATILVSVSSLQYFNAIIIPSKDKNAINLVYACSLIGLCLALLIFLVLIPTYEYVGDILNTEGYAYWLLFLPIAIVLGAVRDALLVWANRMKQYKRIATGRILNSLLMVSSSIVFGFITKKAEGLLFGFLLGQVCFVIYLVIATLRKDEWQSWNKDGVLKMMKKYSRFPKFTLPAESLRIAGNQVPVFLLGSMLTPAIVGLYNMSNRLLGVPTTVIGSAFAEVFKQKASEAYNLKGECNAMYMRMFKNMFLMSLLPFLIFFIFSPDLFDFVLGSEWREAGIYARYLLPLFLFKFFSSPLSFMYHLTGRQREELLIGIYLFVSTFVIFWLFLSIDLHQTLIIFSVNYSLVYAFIIVRGNYFSKGGLNKVVEKNIDNIGKE